MVVDWNAMRLVKLEPWVREFSSRVPHDPRSSRTQRAIVVHGIKRSLLSMFCG